MNVDANNLQVVHNPSEHRFEAWVNDHLSKLDYVLDGNNFVITSVGVHPELRGQGIAGKLTQVGLEYAKERRLRVIPMCPHAAAYIRKNPEYAELTRQPADRQ